MQGRQRVGLLGERGARRRDFHQIERAHLTHVQRLVEQLCTANLNKHSEQVFESLSHAADKFKPLHRDNFVPHLHMLSAGGAGDAAGWKHLNVVVDVRSAQQAIHLLNKIPCQACGARLGARHVEQ